jgi:hypothetical protein
MQRLEQRHAARANSYLARTPADSTARRENARGQDRTSKRASQTTNCDHAVSQP